MNDANLPPDTNQAMRRSVYFVLIALSAGLSAGRILSTELVLEPSLHRPADRDDLPGRKWPPVPPRAMPTYGSNDRARWATIRALVDDGTYVVGKRQVIGGEIVDSGILFQDGYGTVDRVLHPEKKLFYSSKPPLFSTIVAGEYWLLQTAFAWTLEANPREVVRTILFTFNWLPMVVYLVLLGRLIDRFATGDGARIFVMAVACFATYLSTFLTTLNNHTVAAHASLFALYPFVSIWCDGKRDWWRFGLTGFFAAWTACNEMPAAIFGIALFALCLYKSPKHTFLCFVPAAAIPCAAFLLTNYLAIGQIVPVQVLFGSEWYRFDGSHWNNPRGIDGANEPKSIYAFHLLLGHHGVFSLSPVLLLSVIGFVLSLRRDQRGVRLFSTMAMILGVAMLAFCLWKTNNYGGWTSGPRWFFWLLPLWLLAMIPAVDALWRFRWGRGLCYVLVLFSALSVAYPAWNPWRHPWIYRWLESLGVIQYG